MWYVACFRQSKKDNIVRKYVKRVVSTRMPWSTVMLRVIGLPGVDWYPQCLNFEWIPIHWFYRSTGVYLNIAFWEITSKLSLSKYAFIVYLVIFWPSNSLELDPCGLEVFHCTFSRLTYSVNRLVSVYWGMDSREKGNLQITLLLGSLQIFCGNESFYLSYSDLIHEI